MRILSLLKLHTEIDPFVSGLPLEKMYADYVGLGSVTVVKHQASKTRRGLEASDGSQLFSSPDFSKLSLLVLEMEEMGDLASKVHSLLHPDVWRGVCCAA